MLNNNKFNELIKLVNDDPLNYNPEKNTIINQTYNIKTCNLTWNIDASIIFDYVNNLIDDNDDIIKASFMEDSINLMIEMEFFPKGWKTSNDGYSAFFINLKKKRIQNKVFVKYEVCLFEINHNNDKKLITKYKNISYRDINNGYEGIGCSNFIKKELLTNDNIKIYRFNIKIFEKTIITKNKDKVFDDKHITFDINPIYFTRPFSDFKIKSKNYVFNVNKVYLYPLKNIITGKIYLDGYNKSNVCNKCNELNLSIYSDETIAKFIYYLYNKEIKLDKQYLTNELEFINNEVISKNNLNLYSNISLNTNLNIICELIDLFNMFLMKDAKKMCICYLINHIYKYHDNKNLSILKIFNTYYEKEYLPLYKILIKKILDRM